MFCAECQTEIGSLAGNIGLKAGKAKPHCLKCYDKKHIPTKDEVEAQMLARGIESHKKAIKG